MYIHSRKNALVRNGQVGLQRHTAYPVACLFLSVHELLCKRARADLAFLPWSCLSPVSIFTSISLAVLDLVTLKALCTNLGGRQTIISENDSTLSAPIVPDIYH